MKMEVGPEVNRQIVLKLRMRLKALLAEHEVKSDTPSHRILLGDLIRIVEDANRNKIDIPWYDGDL
jgi:hypothetical protein